MRRAVVVLFALACSEPPPSAPATPAEAPPPPPVPTLPPEQAPLLDAWYRAVGARRPNERFGELIARAGLVQLGVRYLDQPDQAGPEELRVDLATFECVSFVESTVALARCIWVSAPDAACFLREVEASRYRGGRRGDFTTRLHYFEDWLDDNASRGRLRSLTATLGGEKGDSPVFYMSRHPQRYPALAEPGVLAEITATESRLTERRPAVLGREAIAGVEPELHDGDIVAFVGSKPGLMISHAGFILRGTGTVARVLHASSHHARVLLTSGSLASYVERRPERRGVLLARPLAPEELNP